MGISLHRIQITNKTFTIMENNITLSNRIIALNAIIGTRLGKLSVPVEMLRKYYSTVLERDIDMRQTWFLINAQLAFVFAAFPVDGPIVLRIACCVWFIHAVLLCKRHL